VSRSTHAVVLALGALIAVAPGGSALAQSASPAASPAAPSLPACTAIADAPVVTTAGSPAPVGSPAAAASELTVFGAASLRGAFEAFAPALQADTGIAPLYSFDASSALRTQIEQGAPADVFASADTSNVVTLLEAGQAGSPVVFACNQLTIIVPAGNPAGIASAQDLGRAGVRVVAAGDEVPITKYAVQLVGNLGIADAYAANIASREDNVAAVRSKIELGEGDAGIVYVTDAIASGDKVEQVPVPAEANVPATYAAAVVTGTDQPDESAAFLAWLTGPEGQGALGTFGFLPAP
jgi:molybdate transport system substrate-binding protein